MRFERTSVLMYHRVLPDESVAFGGPSCYRLRGTAITPSELRTHLDWLVEQQISVVPLTDVVEACARQECPPPGVVLTFDDGYSEWLTVVAPELQTRQMAATFFVSTGVHAGAAYAHPIDQYYYLLDHARVPELTLTLPDGHRFVADLRVPADKRRLVHGQLKQWLVRGTPDEQTWLLATIRSVLGVAYPPELPATLYLRRAAWPLLVQAGNQVEAHGHSHRRLTELSDFELDQELAICFASLSPHLGKSRCFAYPDGACDDRVAARVAATGASCAVTVVPGDVTAASDRFRLPRYFVSSGMQLGDILR